jgi:hypothetical protein
MIAGGGSTDEVKGREIAEKILQSMREIHSGAILTPGLDNFDPPLVEFVLTQLANSANDYQSVTDSNVETNVLSQAEAVSCPIELGKFNPGFWNDPAYVRRNNCYNYATNRRTNTFAQPGRASGHPYQTLTCPDVAAAALSDGAHRRFDCFPDSEKPRWFMALVIAPGFDYHWYRKQLDGCWGHKPGATPAKNTDNNGQVITNPETCARAPYTDFCGYFYACKSMKVN